MKKKNAILDLNSKIEDLELPDFDIAIWVNTIAASLKMIFVKSYRDKISNIEAISFIPENRYKTPTLQERENKLSEGKQKAKLYLDKYIKEIETHGIEKVEKQGISIAKCWSIGVVIVGAAFTLGIYIGGSKFDRDKSEYYENNKILSKQNIELKRELNQAAKKTAILRDSIKTLDKDISNLAYYIGKIKETK